MNLNAARFALNKALDDHFDAEHIYNVAEKELNEAQAALNRARATLNEARYTEATAEYLNIKALAALNERLGGDV